MKFGLLTGGGDAPGLNAVIRAFVLKARKGEHECVGIRRGWAGLIDNETISLTDNVVSGLLHRGGTILGSSRTNPFKKGEAAVQAIRDNIAANEFDVVVAIGGEDTLGVANRLYTEFDLPFVGVPKTIDNDLNATDFTFGFMTSVDIVSDAVGRLHTTAESHDRVIVLEVMGRHAGWIATYGGLAGGADQILIPEEPYDLEEVCRIVNMRYEQGKRFSIIVIAEGAHPTQATITTESTKLDEFGHVRLGGVGEQLANAIEEKTGHESRYVSLGHVQRGGSPNAFDRILGTRYGFAAFEAAIEQDFGKMVALQANKILRVPLSDGVGELKTVDMEIYNIAREFFGY